MALVPMRLMLITLPENGYASRLTTSNNMERIQAIMQAAHEADSPVILPSGARNMLEKTRHLILAAVETPHIPIAMHQDHGNSPSTCYSGIRHGFTSVMMDGSLEADAKTPAAMSTTLRSPAQWKKLTVASAWKENSVWVL